MTEHLTRGVLQAQDLSGRYVDKYLFIVEPGTSPHWQRILMVQHRENGDVKVRTHFEGGGTHEHEFGGSDLVEVAEAVAL